mgnify:CR=1 FL=1
MSWRRTSFFLAALALTWSVYHFYIHGKPRATESVFSFSQEPVRPRVLSLNPGELVHRMTIRDVSKESSISFLKLDDQSWRVKEPVDYPAESVMVDGFVSLLKLNPRIRELSFEGLEASEFGFDVPSLSICVATNIRPAQRCLIIGSDAAIAKGAYAKWKDEGRYFLVDQSFLQAFDKTLYSVRKKQVFNLLEKEIESIHRQSEKSAIEIQVQGKQWVLAKPVEAVLGPKAMDDLLIELNHLYVKEFLDDEPSKDSKLGFDPPSRSIQVRFKDDTHQTLILGREASRKDAYYARSDESGTILLISSGKVRQIERAFDALVS